ncbi:MAG: tetratricopeptide repeat protein, partial [Caldilineaceae bacterium]|nr:tetratricopeptide repeat protein [Caldilineaceae bacterium]
RLIGHSQQALQDLQSVLRAAPVLAVDAYIAQGVLANDESRFAEAHTHFDQALQQTAQIIEVRRSAAHKGKSWAYCMSSDLDAALREAQLARYEAERMQGIILERSAQYNEATQLYNAALTLAKELGHQEGIANTANSLSILRAFQGNFAEAKALQTQAQEIYQRLGMPGRGCNAQINLALIHNLSGDHDAALAVLQNLPAAAAAHQIIFSPQTVAHINYHTAEAYLGLGDIAQAEHFVTQALQIEEEELIVDCYRVVSEIKLAQGDVAAAENAVRFTLQILDGQSPPNLYLCGYCERVLARVLIQAGQWEAAKAVIARAIVCFQELELFHEVEKTRRLLDDLG